MNVAWHAVPGPVGIASRPVGNGLYAPLADERPLLSIGESSLTKNRPLSDEPNHTVPYGTDHVSRFPRHFVPGYFHQVPTGQTRQPTT